MDGGIHEVNIADFNGFCKGTCTPFQPFSALQATLCVCSQFWLECEQPVLPSAACSVGAHGARVCVCVFSSRRARKSGNKKKESHGVT